MDKMKLLSFIVLIGISQLCLAKTNHQKTDDEKAQIQTIEAIFKLAKNNEFMNLKAVSQAFDEPKLLNQATKNTIDSEVVVFYDGIKDNPNHALKNIRFNVWFRPYKIDVSEISGAVEFNFKEGLCPSLELIEEVTGIKADTHQVPYSPSPSGRTTQLLTYTKYYFYLPNQWVGFLNGRACRMELYTRYKPVGLNS